MLQSLLHELRRRRVFRVLIAYAVAAWVVIEVSDTIFPRLGLPDWTVTLVIVLALAGAAVAVALAWAFDLTPEGVQRTPPLGAVGAEPAGARVAAARGGLLRGRGAWFGLGFLVALLGAWVLVARPFDRESASGPDQNVIAILPFRTAGADPSLSYLREGMLDLLAAKLTGGTGPRAVDPRTLMSAWRRAIGDDQQDLSAEAARALAEQLGAGRLVLGEAVGARDGLTLTASVVSTATGRVHGPIQVRGPADSLPTLVDRLTAGLLSLEAGEDAQRLGVLMSTSLPALQAYLQGQAANRRGGYDDARRHFEAALQHDSTFALAALGLNTAVGWLGGLPEVSRRSFSLAWAQRERLPPPDRAFLEALGGPRYPLPHSAAEELLAGQRALELAPDRAEFLEMVGDQYFHYGRILDIPDADRLAAEYMARAVALDSGFVGSLQHLVQLAAKHGDTAQVRRLGAAYLARDSVSDGATYVRWRVAVALNDRTELDRIRGGFDALSPGVLFWIAITGQEEAVAVEDAIRAGYRHYQAADTPGERQRAAANHYFLLLNLGRPSEALRVAEAERQLEPGRQIRFERVLDALYADGDRGGAATEVRSYASWADAPLAQDTEERLNQLRAACVIEQWRLWEGETRSAARTIARLRSPSAGAANGAAHPELEACATFLEALLAAVERRPSARALVDRFDALLRTAPPLVGQIHSYSVGLARLHEMLGDPHHALAATRLRSYWSPSSLVSLATLLREEARLAALTGDTAGALRALDHYLALRADPEPALAAEVDRLRAERTRLLAAR